MAPDLTAPPLPLSKTGAPPAFKARAKVLTGIAAALRANRNDRAQPMTDRVGKGILTCSPAGSIHGVPVSPAKINVYISAVPAECRSRMTGGAT